MAASAADNTAFVAGTAGSVNVTAAGYPVVLDPRTAGTLFRYDRRRMRVRLSDAEVGAHADADTDASSPAQELSTDAALRPVFQDAVLPTVAAVLGPGEITYQAMIGGLYRLFSVPQPVLLARQSYTFVPARGPYYYLASVFSGPVPGDTVVPFVHEFIKNGPLRDVFPSMHTCLPLAIFLFSARYYRKVAFVTGIWIPHIIMATMYLRYHYLIDVLAGITLAVGLFVVARPALMGYQSLRKKYGIVAGP